MIEDVDALANAYRTRGLLIDTNVLLVLIVGSRRRDDVGQGRTNRYSKEDYDELREFVERFERILTTPHILAETSNLLGHRQRELQAALASWIVWNREDRFLLREDHTPARDLVGLTVFPDLGLTDSGIWKLEPGDALVLTDDLPLYHRLVNKKVDAINFNHLRTRRVG